MFIRRLLGSPMKVMAFLTTAVGLLAILTFSYFFFLGIYLLGIGLLLYIIDFALRKLSKNRRIYEVGQTVLTLGYLVVVFVFYMRWQEHNYIILPKDFDGQSGIIFGIEGYPELPKAKFWKRTITLPEMGILITSTKFEDIPRMVRFGSADSPVLVYPNVRWNPNVTVDCIVCDNKIEAWSFSKGKEDGSNLKDLMVSLCNNIVEGKEKSFYKSEDSSILQDANGNYLWLMNRGLSTLPRGIGKLSVYKAILTDNNFTSIPEQIFEIKGLEDLVLAVNPLTEFPCELPRLHSLKSVSFAETGITKIPCDLSKMDSLAHFDLSRNDLTTFPEKIKTIPSLKWLSLQNNKLADITFIDERLQKLETLYLYNNVIKSLTQETKFLGNVRELLIFDNEIDSIPDNIADLKNLEELEIWDNPITYISPKIATLTGLRSLRLDDDFLTEHDKKNLRKWLPNCTIFFQTRAEKMMSVDTIAVN
ncbi:leucine-rich repeat domain-containing protein [Sphingobacterium corticibacterium]|uniref:Leucine-rich repeat domain-containing protein n=1 Tax=Sphingobacterium corticibacterium TaxID=2484746 RepID=A0A4Q6XMW2_9SPHI|nr:leucine-rich repeat domain-containing protein [Sphingobacterium corticibacterium]RZF61453.1 leucine-rich repeat domain-containing protein [Sphingobacterium corticibacterium]